MKIDDGLMRRIASDLGLNVRYEKGSTIPVKNCWHFMTDGNAVDALFCDEEDFRYGMNLVFLMSVRYGVTVLAFTLMDTHVHFVLYGDFRECNRMMHEYVRRLAIHLSNRHGTRGLASRNLIQHQCIDDDNYLKTAICYVLKNAPAAGLPYNAWDYPWSSAPLYFRRKALWGLGDLESQTEEKSFSERELYYIFHGGTSEREHETIRGNLRMIGEMVYPGEYVAWEVVEKIFRTNRGFNYFLGRTKDSDVESREGTISYLTIPIREMRQHKREFCQKMFGESSIKNLNTSQRLQLARSLRSAYNCSKKEIARICGLVYAEVENLLA